MQKRTAESDLQIIKPLLPKDWGGLCRVLHVNEWCHEQRAQWDAERKLEVSGIMDAVTKALPRRRVVADRLTIYVQ